MQIQFFQNPISFNKPSSNGKCGRSPLAPLPCDTVSFGAVEKNSLKEFDRACTYIFKPPLEKLKDEKDFQNWAQNKLNGYFDEEYEAKDEEVSTERTKNLQEWKDYLKEKDNIYIKNPALSLIIFSAVVKDLNKDNSYLPPPLNKAVLSATVEQIEDNLKKDKSFQFDFNKTYNNNLILHHTQAIEEIKDKNAPSLKGWIKIPSKIHDEQNFDKNVEKLRALSHKNWCTKYMKANKYLAQGDFHIYYENNTPGVGVRFIGNKIAEIQGEKNNGKIPHIHLNVIESFMDKNKFKCTEDSKIKLEKAQKTAQKIEKMTLPIKESIEKKDYKAILDHFGFEPKVLEDKTLEIAEFKQPNEAFTFEDINVNENDLFKHISRIKGSANFKDSQATNLGKLESIGGSAFFEDSQVENLGKLRSIAWAARFNNSRIKNLGKLESIGGNALFEDSQVENLGKLQKIGGNAYFYHSKIETLGNLESIGGEAGFRESMIKDWSKVKIGEKIYS